jgi:hypothetical protein
VGNVVPITITVTDANAAEAVQQVTTQLNALGPAAAAAGAEAGMGLDQIGGRATTAREQVRLVTEELGLRVPRAMQSVIAHSQMMATAIGAIAPAMIAIGGVDILVHLGEQAYALWQKYVDLKEIVDDSNTVIKSFGDSAEAAMNRASDATERYIRLTQGAQAADLYKLNKFENTPITISQYQSDQFRKLPDTVKGDFEKITGESIMPKDIDAAIAKLKVYEDSAKQTLTYMQFLHDHPLPTDPYSNTPTNFSTQSVMMQQKQVDIGAQLIADLTSQQAAYTAQVKENQAQIDADGKAKAKEAEAREKEKVDAILSLETSARNAQLSGEALLEAQREEAIDNFVRKYGQSRAAIDAIDTEFAQKEIDLWQKQWDEADKAMQAAKQAAQQQAHTGAGSIENERQNAMADISGKKLGAPGAADELRAAANMKANTEILAAQKEFEDQMDQIGARSNDQQIQGYARIADQASQSVKKIEDNWQHLADKVGALSTAGVDASLEAADRILQVNEAADRQMQQLHQRTMEMIGKEEEQTARQSLSAWQQQQLRIVDDFQDRVQRIQDLEYEQAAALEADRAADAANDEMYRRAEVMNAQDADRQIFAARKLMNAEMQQSDQETRDRLAQGLQSLFSNPAQFFEKRAMDTAFQLMANEMLSAFKSTSPVGGILQYLFGMGPQMSTGTNPLDAMGSALGIGGHGTAGLSASSAVNPSLVQFQQGSTTLLTASQVLTSAATTLQSAAGTMAASGGLGIGSGGGGFSVPGFGGAAIGTATGSGGTGDFSELGAASNSLMMPGLGGSSLTAAGAFDNPMMLPGLNGVASESALNLGGAASGAAASGAKGLGAAAGIAGGALMAGTSIYSAYQNSNPLAGAIGGAMGGMEAGAALGSIVPGIGTVVGAIGGALIGGIGGLFAGLFGDKGRGQAQNLDMNTIQPALTKDMQDYEAGRTGYNTVATELNSMLISAQNQTFQMGSGARSYFSERIQPEIYAVLSSLQKQEKGGRSAITLSAAQYHDGGWTGDFGDLATSETEGFIHAAQNEFVVNPMAAAAHAPILQAMNSGTSFAYANSVQPRMPASYGGGPTVQVVVKAIDSKDVAQWAKAGGGLSLMAALNQAQRQYSGVGRG